MTSQSVTQIFIRGQKVGIIALDESLKSVAEEFHGKPDVEIENALLSKLSNSNYIPESVKDFYRIAFFREYKKFMGEPVGETDADEGLEIKILGPGCPNCEGLERLVMAVVAELQIPADIEHVRNPLVISEYKVMGTPALIVNKKVVSVGKIPSRSELKSIFSGICKRT
ncbi:MAG: thioredoxin family protein [Thermodesulfobacteriota bacterium]